MKKPVFGFWGHAYNRKIFYTAQDGVFNEYVIPGGVSLIQCILNSSGLTEYDPLDNTARCEYFELKQFEDKQSKRKFHAISRYLGFSEGDVTPVSCDAEYAVVYDEGFGDISIPTGNSSVLWASNKVLPEKDVFSKIAEPCFLLLDVNVLRNNGVMISSKISWERSATELIWQFNNNPILSHLHKAQQILITFAEDGAVYIKQEKGRMKASLVLAHGGNEGFLRENNNNLANDAFAFMTTALAMQLLEFSRKRELRVLPILQAAESVLSDGFLLEKFVNRNFDMPKIETETAETSFEIPFCSGQSTIDPDFWCISNNVSNKRIFDIAFEYVLKGAKIIKGLPQLSFGALTTIDRWEIESYRNVCNLIDNYVHSNSVRPLSIAVFGSPGSGKSFGVTQIAKNILPGKVEKLEFNVSQFTDNIDLGIAFQQVRDVILEGKLPLVFFDEFDSDRNGIQLGWIKNFLMPMQDGKFKDESGEHPLGKCILVFAGGTSASFEEFTTPMTSDNTDEQKKFKDIKGPDFVSRLRGTINVLGPNQVNQDDKNYILRRALLLRSLCERKLKMGKGMDTPISKNVLWAMLLVPKYKHGARSMEAILDMSRIEGNVWEPVSLPFYSQLSLHVDADAFLKLILREVLLNSYVEKMAVAIHESYLRKMIANGNTNHPSAVSWEELSEELKESNRNQARNIADKLKSIGCEYDSGDTPFLSIEQFDEETFLFLAQKEHIRWCDEKLANGWKFAPLNLAIDKDTAIKEMRKIKCSHLITEWGNLDKEEQDKDIKVVENIIPLLKSIGLRVYKVI